MWLYTTFGFFSVIEHKDTVAETDPSKKLLLVRARMKGDLERLRDTYFKTPDGQYRLGEIVVNLTADYPYRALVWQDEFAAAMSRIVLDINYTNFKSEVGKQQGWDRHDLYMRVWVIMKDAERTLRSLARKSKYTSAQGGLWDNVKDIVPLLGSGKRKSKKQHYDIDEELDREKAVDARNRRLADHGSPKLQERFEEDEAKRKARHVEEIARKQLKGTRDDFDLDDDDSDDSDDNLKNHPDEWQDYGVGLNPEDMNGMHVEAASPVVDADFWASEDPVKKH